MRGFSYGDKMATFYDGAAWKIRRATALRRDGYLDQIELRYGRHVEAETVHHIFPLDLYPEYRLELWNLISVSKQTHNRLHERGTGALSAEGMELARRTARKYEREIDWARMSPPGAG